MTIVNGYCTSAELKARLGIVDSLDDPTLDQAINSASRAIDGHCGRRFWKDTATTARTYQASCLERLDVDDFWDSTTLVVKGDDNDDGVFETTWLAAEIELDPPNHGGIEGWPYMAVHSVNRSFLLPSSRRYRHEVTAKWGWTAVPEAVHEAVLLISADLWKRKDAPFGVAGFGEFGAVRVGSDVVRPAESLLARYRRADIMFGIA